MAFFASAFAIGATVLLSVVPGINLGGHATQAPLFPAPPGNLLPWAGGEIHAVSQGEETPFTHNGAAAYAFDFDLSYDTVVAARSGKVTMVRQDSNSGGCSAFYSASTNYVVIDHGDGTSGVYMHLAYNSVTVQTGQVVAQGEAIAVSGETGVTCAGIGMTPGAHLHFQVERTETGQYFTQSLPIAFDDVPGSDGVPQEGTSYVSGNYGPGKPQKIKLTPRRVSREFDPRAVPLDPGLIEFDPAAVPTPTPDDASPTEPPTDTPVPSDTPLIPDSTRAPTDTPTPTPVPAETPLPPSPTDTPPPPAPSNTPAPPAATATQTPAPSDTPTPPAALPGGSDTPSPVPSP